MKIAIIASEKDEAGKNIHETLLEMYEFEAGVWKGIQNEVSLHLVKKESIDCEDIDQEIKADLFIFATKHQSKAGHNSLSVHAPGNWGKADFGGNDSTLCVAPAAYLKEGLKKLEELNNIGFDVIQEVTHHGPFMEKPVMFIEIGSSHEQWTRKDAANIIAKAIHHLVTAEIPKCRTAVGIGGLHTTPNFKKIILNSDIALGHVCPKYNLENLDEKMLKEALEKTEPKADLIILDWKGLKEHKQRIKELTENSGLEVIRTDKF